MCQFNNKNPPPKKQQSTRFCSRFVSRHSRFAFGGVDARVCFQSGGQQVGAHHHRFTGPLATFKLLPFHFGLQKKNFRRNKINKKNRKIEKKDPPLVSLVLSNGVRPNAPLTGILLSKASSFSFCVFTRKDSFRCRLCSTRRS